MKVALRLRPQQVLETSALAAALQDYPLLLLPIDSRDFCQETPAARGGCGCGAAAAPRLLGQRLCRCGYAQPLAFRPSVASDRVLPSARAWTQSILLECSPWLTVDQSSDESSDDPSLDNSRSPLCMARLLLRQLSWANHCSPLMTVLPTPLVCAADASRPTTVLGNASYDVRCEQLVATFERFAEGTNLNTHFVVSVPLTVEESPSSSSSPSSPSSSSSPADGWHVWHAFRKQASASSAYPSLGVALTLTASASASAADFERWLAEPIHLVVLPSHVLPLSAALTRFVLKLTRSRSPPRFVVDGEDSRRAAALLEDVGKQNAKDLQTNADLQANLDFQDVLQMPLQPLRDHLESGTYEIFEADIKKYEMYQKAIAQVLRDRITKGFKHHTVGVVGAGRGGLVEALFRAVRDLNLPEETIEVQLVEKSPNACITLRERQNNDKELMWRNVTIHEGDMRSLQSLENASLDIMVSELLGSFGDNELSPECLDGAERFLKGEGKGVCIPRRYVSSLEPISAPNLWGEAKKINKGLETQFVVNMHRVYRLSREGPQDCFEFVHPARGVSLSNDRFRRLVWTARNDAVCHGFAGYFDAELFKSVSVSTDPRTLTPDMFSWFPLYLPLKEPFEVRAGQRLELCIWRRSDFGKTWYEWMVRGSPAGVHNLNGTAQAIHLS